MGINKNGIFNGHYGRTGGVVARSVKGRVILSIYQPQVTNPRTALQMSNRNKFAALTEFLKPISTYLRHSFAAIGNKKTKNYFSSAVGYNCKIENIYANDINYDRVVLSVGNLVGLSGLAFEKSDSTITFSWSRESGVYDDNVCVCVYDILNKRYVYYLDCAKRGDSEMTIEIYENTEKWVAWLSVNDGKGHWSTSQALF